MDRYVNYKLNRQQGTSNAEFNFFFFFFNFVLSSRKNVLRILIKFWVEFEFRRVLFFWETYQCNRLCLFFLFFVVISQTVMGVFFLGKKNKVSTFYRSFFHISVSCMVIRYTQLPWVSKNNNKNYISHNLYILVLTTMCSKMLTTVMTTI